MAIRFTAEFLVTARPTQAKIDLLVRQMKLTPEQVEMCIYTDPSPNQTDYVTWIARWLSKGQIRLPEDAEGIRNNLTTFTTQKRQPTFQGNKDVNAYSPAQLAEVIQQNAMTVVRPKDIDKIRGLRGVSVLAQKGDITVFKIDQTGKTAPEQQGDAPSVTVGPPVPDAEALPDNVKALQVLSDSTEWCTRGDYARTYLKDGPSFVVFYRGQPYAQLHPQSNQFMNRSDSSLVKEYHSEGKMKREYRGWGHYRQTMGRGEFLGTGIPDPVANEALVLMRARAPEVEEWAREKNVVSDPSVLAKRLKGTQHWLDAAVMEGVALTPQEEETLGSLRPDDIEAYANKFHPQGRWEPMERALLAHLKDRYDGVTRAISYAATRIGGRWPELEPTILRYATSTPEGSAAALQYATQVVKGRWPELEARFFKTKGRTVAPALAASYAIDVLKQPWRDVLPQSSFKWGMAKPEALMCLNDPDEAIRYAEHFKFGQWPEFAQVLQANHDLEHYISYLDKVEGKKRDPHLEARLISPGADTYRAQVPLNHYEKRQWHWKHPGEQVPEYLWKEIHIPKDALANLYTQRVLGQRWPEFEERMLHEVMDKESSILPKDFKMDEGGYSVSTNLHDPFHTYIRDVVQGRWPEFEQALLQRYQDYPDTWKTNQSLVTGYIKLIATVTKQEEELRTDNQYGYHEVKPLPGIWPEGEAVLKQRSPSYEESLRADAKDAYEKCAQHVAERERRALLPEKERNKLPYQGYSDTELWAAGHRIKEYILYLRSKGNDWPEGVTLLNEIEDFRQGNKEAYYTSNRLKEGSVLARLESHRLLRPQRLPRWH